MLKTHRLIGLALALATVIILFGPSALAGEGNDKDQTASEDCPGNSGNGNGQGHGNGRACDEDASEEETSAAPADEEEDESTSGDEHPPGQNRANGQPTPTPSASPSPPGTGQPTDPGAGQPGALQVDVEVDSVVAQVGATLTYEIHITNTGSDPVTAVVYNDVPDEVELLSATLPRTASSAPFGWSLENLAPGSVTTLRWKGQVSRLGDLDAVNVVTVEAEGIDSVPVETHTYLASVQGLRVSRSSTDPDWGTHTERRVVLRAPDPESVGSAGAAEAPSQLPQTGVPILEISYLAGLLLLGGLVLLGRGKRLAAVGMMVVLVAAACTSEPPADDRTDVAEEQEEQDENKEGDRVLGTRVSKDPKTPEPGTGSDDGTTGSNGVPGVATGEAPDGADENAEGSDITTDEDESVVKEVVLVTVENEAPEPERVGSADASNTITLTWEEPSRSIITAASSRLIGSESPIELTSSVSDSGNAMSANVVLTNITQDDRLLVEGHLVMELIGTDGSVIPLFSPQISDVLDPGDQSSADFVLAAPSGDYTIRAAFVAS